MNMQLLTGAVGRLPEFEELLSAIEGGACPAAVSGLAAVHRAHIAAGLAVRTDRPIVVVCADESECQRMARDLAALTGQEVPLLLSRPFTFHRSSALSHQWEQQRLALLSALHRGEVPVLVAAVEGLLQRTLSPHTLASCRVHLRPGLVVDPNELTETLVRSGYTRCQQVEGVGQFALRGGILDVFAPGWAQPVRCEFFGDEVDAMGRFDPATQRRTENVDEVFLLPAAEVLPHTAPGGLTGLDKTLEKLSAKAKKEGLTDLHTNLERDREGLKEGRLAAPDRYLPLIAPDECTAAHFLPPDACVIFSETARVAERARTYQWQTEEDVGTLLERQELAGACGEPILPFPRLCQVLGEFPCVYLDSFTLSQYPLPPRTLLSLLAKQLPAYGLSLESAAQDLDHYRTLGYSCLVLCSGEQRALDLQTFLREHKVPSAVSFRLPALPQPGQVVLTVGGLSAGIEYPGIKLAVLAEGDSRLPKRKTSRPKKDVTNRQKLKSYTDLVPGDLVVHEQYGLGRFVEMTKLTTDGVEKDYIKLAYAGTDVLYVPATGLDQVSKYIGAGSDAAETRKLSRLGGGDWERAKSKARKAVADLAKGLIQLYAQRQRQPGYAFSPDTPWQREFEEQFEYVETDDQLRCIADIKRDMERPIPMDRLLCGDVGYGKTEVAFRAVMKCVMEGKQAAILAPTTVLARQHYITALKRFSRYPVNIEVVSRFRSTTQIKDILRRVSDGRVDILIGTHRLFNKDVDFKDLGLLVVDEEQRFGVQHKEKLKERFQQVDVLTLSATPIPRTLNMALSGIRDMSTLEEPPSDRQPVQTYVLEHDWGVLADAMRRELERGGQVYYLHNRVDTIDRCAAHLQVLLGEEAAIGIAHGKMTQEAIDNVMSQMTDGELNVLVCTTIIETGIDVPNANTLIIENADFLGLAQLHQIRGRVGRSSRRAFAYLTYTPGKVLSEVSTKRLSAIREFAEFGSGFKIAMRDLEIRGAGNILGPEQSGFLLSVGYDMYLRLLEEAVLTQQGLPVPKREDCVVNLPIAASIPDRYIPAQEQRMDLYRRIAAIRTEEDADDLVDELIDRYGEPPRTVNNLITVALLRGAAIGCGVTAIDLKGSDLVLTLSEPELERLVKLCEQYQRRLTILPGNTARLSLKLAKDAAPLKAARTLIEDYAKI